MLKYVGGVVLFVVVLVSAYASPAYAASASVIMAHVQPGRFGASLEEFVDIYNNSSEEVDISGWCLKNKTNQAFACFTPPPGQAIYLPAHAFGSVGSTAFTMMAGPGLVTIEYTPTNQSSGSLVGSNDTVVLVSKRGEVVDTFNWTTSLNGNAYARSISPDDPMRFIDTDQLSDWGVAGGSLLPDNMVIYRPAPIDVCPNLDGDQSSLPEGYRVTSQGDCVVPAQLLITELLPNAEGSDEGEEYIELFNPTDAPVSLDDYILWVGPEFEKSYHFPTHITIPASGYVVVTNEDIAFSLLNSSSRVKLTLDDQLIAQTPPYENPADGAAWAAIAGEWRYVLPTPGEENVTQDASDVGEIEAVSSEPKPCASNQYRSPETNRCRLIASDTKTVTPCEPGEERNIETNRCRKIAVAATATPCKEGQERNPETNRCRTIKSLAKADYGVLGAQTTQSGNWYVWAAIGLVVILALGYVIWEWRYELLKLIRRITKFRPWRK